MERFPYIIYEIVRQERGLSMSPGVVVALSVFLVMVVIAVIIAVISAVSSVSGIETRNDED